MRTIRKCRRLISERLYDPLFWRYKRLPVVKFRNRFRDLQWDTSENFKVRQKKMLTKILRHALDNIPHFKSLATRGMLSDLEKDPYLALRNWPITTKADILREPKSFYKEIGRGTFVNSTGGSSGTPLTIFQDKLYQSVTLAATDIFYEWAGCPIGGPKVKLWGAERDIVGDKYNVKYKVLNFLANRVILNCFVMTPELMAEYVAKLNSVRPWLIEGYADAVYELATYAKSRNIKFNFRPRGIITSAGTLMPHMRSLIEQVFDAKVFDRYGSREAGNIACECEEHNGLHVMGETTLLEVVDSNGNMLSDGEEGEILVTNLWNFTMPLIRYKIEDRGILSGVQCRCGRPYPVLQQVTGRSSSCLYRKDGGIVSPAFFIHFIGVVHNDGSILKFQIVQESIGSVIVRLVPKPGFRLEDWPKREYLVNHIRKVMGEHCEVCFELVDSIEKTQTGKYLYTVCNVWKNRRNQR